MTQHTQGRLKLGRVSHSAQSAEIDAESNTAWMDAYPWEGLAECRGCDENKTRGAAVMEANARRLVAAWNAFDGVPTDDIEKLDARGLALVGGFIDQLSAQRDELLAALTHIEGAALDLTVSRHAISMAAYAAIAKVEA